MARVIPIPIAPIYIGESCRGLIHVVQKGDTLYQLGKQYHVSVGQLMFANPFVDVYNLQIGDELCIPVSMRPRQQDGEEMGRMQGETDMQSTHPREQMRRVQDGNSMQPRQQDEEQMRRVQDGMPAEKMQEEMFRGRMWEEVPPGRMQNMSSSGQGEESQIWEGELEEELFPEDSTEESMFPEQ